MSSTVFNKEAIAKNIPHGKSMSLLESVLSIDEDKIICEAISHRDPNNPLIFNDKLSATAVIEYSGQAIALHRYFLHKEFDEKDRQAPKEGYLAALKKVQFTIENLSEIERKLQIEAKSVYASGDKAYYEFRVLAEGVELVSGEMIVAEAN